MRPMASAEILHGSRPRDARAPMRRGLRVHANVFTRRPKARFRTGTVAVHRTLSLHQQRVVRCIWGNPMAGKGPLVPHPSSSSFLVQVDGTMLAALCSWLRIVKRTGAPRKHGPLARSAQGSPPGGRACPFPSPSCAPLPEGPREWEDRLEEREKRGTVFRPGNGAAS